MVERILTRLRLAFLLAGGGLAVLGGVLLVAAFVLSRMQTAQAQDCRYAADCEPAAYKIERLVPLTPTPTAAVSRPAPAAAPTSSATPAQPVFADGPPAATPAVTATIRLTATAVVSKTVPPTPDATVGVVPAAEPVVTATVAPTHTPAPAAVPAPQLVAEETYTSTDQVHARIDPPPDEAVVECPTTSTAAFDLIPFVGSPANHPDRLHPDLKLDRRGYTVTAAHLGIVTYIGPAETGAPQLPGLFQPNRGPNITAAYRVNDWIWDPNRCGGDSAGCVGPPLSQWDVTLVSLAAGPGEAVFIPSRGPEIYGGGYKALVLYAEEHRITLGYTREDSVAHGYAVHIENVCVDPNLLALYQAQTDAGGWHMSGNLPALRNNQALGTARGNEILVAIRDRGTFMDPRAKEWWQGY